MKKTILLLTSVIGLLLPQMTLAQGTLYLSNLSQPSSGSLSLGSDSWRAAYFRTGTNPGGYTLNSVQLLMSPSLGTPSNLAVSLYDNSGRFPGNSLGILTGSDPVAGGVFTYSSPGIVLSTATDYFIVLTSATPVAQGSYNWNIANTTSYNSSDGWSVGVLGSGHGYDSSPNGSSWVYSGSGVPSPQFAVNATAIPEPTTAALAGLGLVCLSFCRRKRGQKLAR